jgi:hypothetical protein
MNKLKVAAIGVIALLAIVVVLQNMQAVREVKRLGYQRHEMRTLVAAKRCI